MAEQTKVYPGDLPPIPFSENVEQQQEQRCRELCEYFGIAFSVPFSLDSARILTKCLVEKHKPESAPWLVPAIPGMTPEALNGLIAEIVSSLPGLQVTAPKGRPKGSKKKQSGQDLKLFSLVHREKHQDQYRGWGPEEKIRRLLRQNPELIPNSRRGEPWRSAYSQYREDAAQARRMDQARGEALEVQRAIFMARCNPATRGEIDRFIELCRQAAEAKDSEPKAKKIEGEKLEVVKGIIFGADWRVANERLKAIAGTGDSPEIESLERELENLESTPWCRDGMTFFNLYMRTDTKWMIQGSSDQ